MDKRTPLRQQEDRMSSRYTSERDSDPQTTQNTPGTTQRIYSHSSGLRAEQDTQQPSVTHSYRGKGSRRMFVGERGPEVAYNEQNASHDHELGIQRLQEPNSAPSPPERGLEHSQVARTYHTSEYSRESYSERGHPMADDPNVAHSPQHETQRSRESSSSSFESSLPIPPPNYRRDSQGELIGETEEPRAPASPQGHEIPRHQLMADSNPFSFGQSSAQQEELKPPPQEISNYAEQQRRFEYDSQFREQRYSRSRKRKKRRGHEGKQAERWDVMFDRLCEFKRLHGHCLVPNRYVEDPSLGAWVSTQRRHYKILLSEDASQTSPMTPERAAKLISIGFQWATKDPRHVPWETRYQELLAYKKEYGDCVVPIGFKENPRLSNWVSAQRQEYKLFKNGKKCRITADRVEALNKIGFVWEAQRGSSGAQRKKRDQKDTLLGRAAAEMLSLAAGGHTNNKVATSGSSFGQRRIPPAPGPPPDNLARPDFAQEALSHALSSILGTQQQSNGPRSAQGGAGLAAASTAARRMDNPVPASQRYPPAASAPPSIASVHPSLALNDAKARKMKGLPISGRTAPPSRGPSAILSNNRVPTPGSLQGVASDEIVTKHLVYALRHDIAANAMGLDVAIQKIHGVLGITGQPFANTDAAHRHISPHQAEKMALAMPPAVKPPPSALLPSFTLPTHLPTAAAKADSQETETESESSKYGSALQVGEVVVSDANPRTVATLGVPRSIDGINRSIRARHSLEGVEPSLSPGLQHRKRPASMMSGNDRLAGIGSTTGDGSGGQESSNASDYAQSDKDDGDKDGDGGVFSDAEEE